MKNFDDAAIRRSARKNRAAWMIAAFLCVAVPGFAQDGRTGVSVPQPVTTTGETQEIELAPPAKPSAAVPMPAPTAASAPVVYQPFVPYRGAGTPALQNPHRDNAGEPSAAFNPDANIVTEATAGRDERRLLSGEAMSERGGDPDAGIVTHVASPPGEVRDGTLIQASLREKLSTLTTRPGNRFSAEVSEPVLREGSVVVPVGSVLEGRVSWVRGGRRIGGSAAIHLEPQTVTLPDGSQYRLHARVIDTSSWQNTKVDSEGTILRGDDTRRNLAVMSLTTGSAMAAGAMIAGLPGALIGAGVGAGISTVVWLKQDRQAELPKGLGVVFSLTLPMSVTPTTAAIAPKPATGTEIPGGE